MIASIARKLGLPKIWINRWLEARGTLGSWANDLSALVGGRELRFRYGNEGLTRLPALARDRLTRTSPQGSALKKVRVYLLHGAPWPGISDSAAWMKPWAKRLGELGVGRVLPIVYARKSLLPARIQFLLDHALKFDQKLVVAQIQRDLERVPRQAGERLALLGHSHGALLSVPVAESLAAKGIVIDTVILVEDRVPFPVGQFVKRAPAVRRVLEIENNPGKPLRVSSQTDYRRHVEPELTHMDFVLNPTPSLFDAILRALGTG